jgi:hypothetical protein
MQRLPSAITTFDVKVHCSMILLTDCHATDFKYEHHNSMKHLPSVGRGRFDLELTTLPFCR